MTDYMNGKIYKLVVDNYDKIYIGSTCQTLSQRLCCHKSEYKNVVKTGSTYKKPKSHELFSKGNVLIILLEDCPCDRKEQLLARERFHIEQNKQICLNMTTPGKTKQEGSKDYYEKNKTVLSAKMSAYHATHKVQHATKAKEYRESHAEEIKARSAIKYKCVCGGSYNYKPPAV